MAKSIASSVLLNATITIFRGRHDTLLIDYVDVEREKPINLYLIRVT